jgi:hypothetical protein
MEESDNNRLRIQITKPCVVNFDCDDKLQSDVMVRWLSNMFYILEVLNSIHGTEVSYPDRLFRYLYHLDMTGYFFKNIERSFLFSFYKFRNLQSFSLSTQYLVGLQTRARKVLLN